MIIEWLKIQVPAATRSEFIEKDAEIWTPALAKYPGFLGKEVWLDPTDPTVVILIVRWNSREQWQAIPPEDLAGVEQVFNQQVGMPYEFLEQKEYPVERCLPLTQ